MKRWGAFCLLVLAALLCAQPAVAEPMVVVTNSWASAFVQLQWPKAGSTLNATNPMLIRQEYEGEPNFSLNLHEFYFVNYDPWGSEPGSGWAVASSELNEITVRDGYSPLFKYHTIVDDTANCTAMAGIDAIWDFRVQGGDIDYYFRTSSYPMFPFEVSLYDKNIGIEVLDYEGTWLRTEGTLLEGHHYRAVCSLLGPTEFDTYGDGNLDIMFQVAGLVEFAQNCTHVPEPMTILIFISGLIVYGAFRIRIPLH